MSRRVLSFILGSVFFAVLLAAVFLLWVGSQVDCPTGDVGTEHADTLCTCPYVKVSLQPYADFTQKEALQLKRDLEKHLGMLIC